MKFISVCLGSYATVAVYMIFINHSPFSWLPLMFIVLILVDYYTSALVSWLTVICTGFFMDIHFQFIGPYILIFVTTIGIARWMQGFVLPRQHMISTIVLIGMAALEYTAVLYCIFGILNGFQYYYHGISTLYQLMGSAGIAWSVPVLTIFIVERFQPIRRYAGR